MLSHRIIPCLDCRDGRVVKGVRFADLRDVGSPAVHAARYEEQGADELVLLDVAATVEGRGHQLATVAAVRRELSIPLTAGGGVREVENAQALLQRGADKVAINSAAVLRPELITEMADAFGSQCVVVAVDAFAVGDRSWRIKIRSGTTPNCLDAVAWCQQSAERGAGEILLTSWDRDGTGLGYDLELLAAVSSAVTIPVIASGGARHPHDAVEAIQAGADAVLAASIFHDGQFTVGDVKSYLANHHLPTRLC